MVYGICKCSIRGYEMVEWPDRFVGIPNIGDTVIGYDKKEHTTSALYVKRIVHKIDWAKNKSGIWKDDMPVIEIELGEH
jgi:hypothetical protein